MKKITYKEIAHNLRKTEGTIKNWKNSHPLLLEYVKIGAFCKENGLDLDTIKSLIAVKEAIVSTKK